MLDVTCIKYSDVIPVSSCMFIGVHVSPDGVNLEDAIIVLQEVASLVLHGSIGDYPILIAFNEVE